MNLSARSIGAGFLRGKLSSLTPFLLVLILVAPSVVQYTPYWLAWDDTYFLHRAVCVQDAVYRLNVADIRECYSILSKSPILTFMTIPWGPAASGENAVPLALISLAILIWIFVLLICHVAIAAGAAAWILPVAALAVWLNPYLNMYGGFFLSDMLVSWCTLLLLLLLPLELRTKPGSPRLDVARGALWGFVIGVGALTKVTFLFFLVSMLAVIWVRFRRLGARSCLRTALAAVLISLPAAVIWALFWRNFVGHAIDASFGGLTKFYAVEGWTPFVYLRQYLVESRWASLPIVALVPYFAWKVRHSDSPWLRMLPLLLVLIYFLLCALSANADYRFAEPVMIALPFLLVVVPAGDTASPTRIPAVALGFGLLASVLSSIPMAARPQLVYLRYAGAVLDTVAQPETKILLATDSAGLSIETFLLAKELRGQRLRAVSIDSLAYDSPRGRSVQDSFQRMKSVDYILVQNPPLAAEPKFLNEHADEFYRYAASIADEVKAPSEYMHVLKVRPPELRGEQSTSPPRK